MAGTLTYFGTSNLIGIAGGWCVQTGSNTESWDRASGLCGGDEAAAQKYNKRVSGTLTAKNYSPSGTLAIPTVGDIMSGYHIDSVAVAYSETDWPELTVSYHKHHIVHSACRTYTPTAVLPAGFGVPDEIKDSDSATIFKLIGSGVGLKSLNYSLTATHVDDTAKNGTWLGGDTHNGVETLGVEFVGKAEFDDMTLSEDWDVTESANGDSGTAGDTSSISMTRGVAKDEGGGGGGGD